MPRGTPPTLISYTEVAYTSFGPLVSASVAWQTGDVIVVIVADETVATIGLPTATGLTFTQQRSNNASVTCSAMLSTAVAGSSSSGAITSTSNTGHCGMSVWVYRGSDGVGVNAEQHTATKTVSLTPTDTHSAFCWAVADFSAGAAGDALTPTPTTTQEAAVEAAAYTVYAGNLDDRASAAATGFGITGAAVTGPFTIVAQEIIGTGVVASPIAHMPRPMRMRG